MSDDKNQCTGDSETCEAMSEKNTLLHLERVDLVNILRGYSINHLATEAGIDAKVIEFALLGIEIRKSEMDAVLELIHEYSQE